MATEPRSRADSAAAPSPASPSAGGSTYPAIAESERWLGRSAGLIPCHTQTLAKGPAQFVRGVAPMYLARGKGAHVWDVDGNEYIDLFMAVGPLSLGYCYDRVDDAIRRQLADGITFSMMHPLEVEVAELVRDTVPHVESVRFSKTGCDVTSAAVRLARAWTGRETVLSCGYHGWHDWHIAVTDRSRGIPEAVKSLSYTFRYNDLAHLEASLGPDVACVIMEPVVFQEPDPGYLAGVRKLCDDAGALLIFDEMWTGFRLAPGGAQEFYGVRADLATYSKAIANGMPISVLAGRRDVMELLDHDVFFFTTFGGEALSLAAAHATISEIREKNVTAFLARQGKALKREYAALCERLDLSWTRVIGPDCRSLVTFDASAGNPLELKSFVQQEMFAQGILWNGFHNMSFSHGDAELGRVVEAYGKVLPALRDAVRRGTVRELLRGEPVGPVFRRTDNFNVRPRA